MLLDLNGAEIINGTAISLCQEEQIHFNVLHCFRFLPEFKSTK